MIELALLLPIAGLLVLLERQQQRARDERAAVEAAQRKEREAWARERAELLNRIKPETAQPVIPANTKPLPPVNLEDDDEYWAGVEALQTETRALIEARN